MCTSKHCKFIHNGNHTVYIHVHALACVYMHTNRGGGREERREGGERRREGGREGGREGREGGREEGKREREGGREGGRKGERKGLTCCVEATSSNACQPSQRCC